MKVKPKMGGRITYGNTPEHNCEIEFMHDSIWQADIYGGRVLLQQHPYIRLWLTLDEFTATFNEVTEWNIALNMGLSGRKYEEYLRCLLRFSNVLV